MASLRGRVPSTAALTVFEAAARLSSFTRAGEELGLTQTAVSRQIAALEQELGVRLFERRRRDVQLTPAGQRLAGEGGPALARLAAIADDLRREGSADDKTLRIYAENGLASPYLLPRLAGFASAFPEIELKVSSSNHPLELMSEAFDLAILTGEWAPERYETVKLTEEVIFPVAAPKVAAQMGKRPKAEQLLEIQLLHLRQTNRDWTDWARFLTAFGVNDKRATQGPVFDNYVLLLDAAAQGQGLALGWGTSVAPRLKDGSLQRVGSFAVPEPGGLRAYLPQGRRSQAALAFLGWLQR